jgi:hypothetical protein
MLADVNIPDDFDGTGKFIIDEEGYLVLEDVGLGSPEEVSPQLYDVPCVLQSWQSVHAVTCSPWWR